MENGNIMDPTAAGRRTPNRLRVLNGCLVGYLQDLRNGEITIQASTPFLKPGELKFNH